MIEPKIKDKVIRLLYEGKGTAEIARTLGIGQNYVIASIRDIQKKFPGGFSEHKGFGDDTIGVSLHPRYKEQMFLFVKKGGFEAEYKRYLASEQNEEYRASLELTQLELAIRAAQAAELNTGKAERRAKNANIWACVSAIAAIVAAIAAVLALFKVS